MPAITVDDTLVLPRIPRPDPATSRARPVARVVTAHRATEGAGFSIRRPFPGELSMAEADPFLLLDHLGPQINAPNEAKGAPWHPHRGFETVSYILDGEIAHHDTNGGGGVIGEGDTQWMTAGGGILHDELPTEKMYRGGGPAHAVQLWVNLPPALKMTTPRYQSITRRRAAPAHLRRRRRAHPADRRRHRRVHRTGRHPHPDHLRPRDPRPRRPARRAVERGVQRAGLRARPVAAPPDPSAARSTSGQLIVFGPGDHLVVAAADRQAEPLDVLLLGGLPIGAPIAHYGPFVMNTREEIIQAVEDYQAGRLGIIPADQLAPRSFA